MTTAAVDIHDSPGPTDDGLDFFSEMLELLPVGALLTGHDGVIALVNQEAQRLFGYSGAELIGQSVDVLVPDVARDAPALHRQDFAGHPLARPVGAGRPLFGRRKDGSEMSIEVALKPISLRGAEFVLTSVVDVSVGRGLDAETDIALGDRLEFEQLIGELGAEFVNLRPDEVDRTIEDALGRLVRTLGLDYSALFQVDDVGDFVHTHQWTRPGWAPPLPRVSAKERFPWHLAQVRAGELVRFATVDEVPDEIDRDHLRRTGTKSGVTIPLMIGGTVWGALTFAAVRAPRRWTPAAIGRLRVVAVLFANVLARKIGDEHLRKVIDELASLRDRWHDETVYLRHEVNALAGTAPLVGHSPAIRRVLEQIRQVGPTDSTVLLIGETGTGKSLLATHVHELSARSEHAMMRVNCAHLSPAWIEGELAGSEQGSHANGESRRAGHLGLAHGSTVFFDEIADLPLEAQASLTRILGRVQPPGHTKPAPMDIRVIAATRKDLKRCIDQGAFRDDLYYRLNVFPIHVPPLRDRREDIPLLVWRFVDEFSEEYGKPIDTIDQASMAALQAYSWPGNARELRNVVERSMIVPTGRRLRIPLPSHDAGPVRKGATLTALEKEYISALLAACGGRIPGKNGAAARLGLSARALESKMATLGLNGPKARHRNGGA